MSSTSATTAASSGPVRATDGTKVAGKLAVDVVGGGAGLSGLTAARDLLAQGVDVTSTTGATTSSRGAHSAAPGRRASGPPMGRSLRAPIGPLHWSGTERSAIWNGKMEGAVVAGKRETEAVLKMLG
jgi:monoamine oxidase